MKLHILISTFILSFSSLFLTSCVSSEYNKSTRSEALTVTVAELLKDPEKYHMQYIQIKGCVVDFVNFFAIQDSGEEFARLQPDKYSLIIKKAFEDGYAPTYFYKNHLNFVGGRSAKRLRKIFDKLYDNDYIAGPADRRVIGLYLTMQGTFEYIDNSDEVGPVIIMDGPQPPYDPEYTNYGGIDTWREPEIIVDHKTYCVIAAV